MSARARVVALVVVVIVGGLVLTPAGAAAGETPALGPGTIGTWTAPQRVGLVGIHAALLRTGKALLYAYPNEGIGSDAAVYDPSTGGVTDVDLPFPRDIFCSGLSVLPDGRVLVVGGMDDSQPDVFAGIRGSTIFDPVAQGWSRGPDMAKARWYPSNVEMPDGTTLVLSGLDQQGQNVQRAMESYDPATNAWTLLPKSARIDTDLFPRMVVLPGGKVFRAGADSDTRLFDPSTNTWSFVDQLNFGYRGEGGVVLLPGLRKVLTAGGQGAKATATAEVIDFSDPQPQWAYTGSMTYARYNLNLVLLADGTALAVGGGRRGSYGSPVRNAELYDPAAATWKVMAAQTAQRTYHSTALLLPDGRVLSAGSDHGTLADTVEIYSPPYLFHGARPVISSAPGSVGYGDAFTISSPDAADITRVALVRPGAVTHANDFDQRYVDLSFSASGGTLSATAPASADLAPPGYYMLFVVSSNGVPSVAPFVSLGSLGG